MEESPQSRILWQPAPLAPVLADRPGVVFFERRLWVDWWSRLTRDERVGVLAGRRAGEVLVVERIFELRTGDRGRAHASIEGPEWGRLIIEAERDGLENLGLIHTHPLMSPEASPSDRKTQRHLGPSMVHIIVSPGIAHRLYWGAEALGGGKLRLFESWPSNGPAPERKAQSEDRAQKVLRGLLTFAAATVLLLALAGARAGSTSR